MATVWQQAGATLSLKNALSEYKGLQEQWLLDAKIPCQWRSYFGNSFPIFVRADVERVAREHLGGQYEIAEARKALKSVNAQLSEVDRQRGTLTVQKEALEAKLSQLGAAPEEPPKPKTATKKGGGRAKATPAQPAKKRGRKAGSDDDEEWRP